MVHYQQPSAFVLLLVGALAAAESNVMMGSSGAEVRRLPCKKGGRYLSEAPRGSNGQACSRYLSEAGREYIECAGGRECSELEMSVLDLIDTMDSMHSPMFANMRVESSEDVQAVVRRVDEMSHMMEHGSAADRVAFLGSSADSDAAMHAISRVRRLSSSMHSTAQPRRLSGSGSSGSHMMMGSAHMPGHSSDMMMNDMSRMSSQGAQMMSGSSAGHMMSGGSHMTHEPMMSSTMGHGPMMMSTGSPSSQMMSGMSTGMSSSGMHSGMHSGMPSSMHSGMNSGMHSASGMGSGMASGMHSASGMSTGMSTGMSSGMHSGMGSSMHSGMSSGMSHGSMMMSGSGMDGHHMDGHHMDGHHMDGHMYSGHMMGGARRRLNLVAPNSRPRCTAQGCGPSIAAAPAVVVQRDTVTTVVRETSCPDGMSLEGSVCVGLDMCPVQYTCPREFVESGLGDCVTESAPVVDCPHGFSLHGGKVCTQGSISAAALVCDAPGYTLDAVSKVCVKEVPQPNTCPAGYSMDGSVCVQRHAPQFRCQHPGQSLSPGKKECVATYTEAAVLNCPDGALPVDGERCVTIRQDPPHCPPRFTLDTNGNACVQTVPKVLADCPPGFTKSGRSCERIGRYPAEPSCPDETFTLKGDTCQKEIPQEPRCPPGTQKSSSMTAVCEKCVEPKPICSDGTTLQGNQCVQEVELPSKECCAAGFKLENGQCVRVEVTAPRLSCEGECYTVESYAVAYACPVGSEFLPHPENPKCVRQTKDEVCAPVVEPAQCPADAATRGLCRTAASSPCSTVLSTDTVPAEPYCANGGALENGRCVVRTPIVPERTCDVGSLDEVTGQCTRTSTLPVKLECPPGATRKGNRCVTTESRPASFVCPEGSTESAAGVCVVHSDAIPVPSVTVRQPASYSCPSGAVLSGKQCVTSSTIEVPQCCPPGSQEGPNGCQVEAPIIVPAPVEKPVRPSFYCSDSAGVLSGRQCTVTQRQPAEPYCSADSYLQGSQCVRTVPQVETPCKTLTATPRPVCPSPTAELRGCMCLEHEEAAPIVSCARGFELSDSGVCERRTAKTPLCPHGTELQGDACVRRVEVAPTVRVINGCEVAPAKDPVCYNGY